MKAAKVAESEGIMKGLLVKDFNILLLQKKFLGLVLMISVIMIMTMEDPSFLIGYITVMCGIVTVSTINYDELDNGNTFLFTMPITRKVYVLEKYVLVVLVSGLAWLTATVASMMVSVTKIEGFHIGEGIGIAVLTFAACMLLEFIMIPIQLKYGGEKSRIVLVAMAGVIIVAAYFLNFLAEKMEGIISIDVEGLLNRINSMGLNGLVVVVVCVSVAVMLISIVISTRIMEKKQF